jgi:hypothetical protein
MQGKRQPETEQSGLSRRYVYDANPWSICQERAGRSLRHSDQMDRTPARI